jgi:hypothetical protein
MMSFKGLYWMYRIIVSGIVSMMSLTYTNGGVLSLVIRTVQ